MMRVSDSSSPDDQRRLRDSTEGADRDPQRCMAIAVSTSERCRRYVVDGTSYCPLHIEDATTEETA